MLKKESRYLMLDKNKKDRLEELLKIVSISDEELEKLT